MTTVHNPTDDQADVVTAAEFLHELATLARASDTPQTIAQGSFALYPMENGGMMFVTSVHEGPLVGVKHTPIPPAMIRAVLALAGGGSKLDAVRAAFGRRPRKEISP